MRELNDIMILATIGLMLYGLVVVLEVTLKLGGQ